MSEDATNEHCQVAWAPFTYDDLDWLRRRDAEAAAWAASIMRRSRDEARRPIVRVDTDAAHWRRDDGPVGRVGRAGSVVTNRSGSGSGPTMAFNPTDRSMAGALACATGHSIVAVEHPTLPLHGWAAAVGAVDLRTGNIVEDALSDQPRDGIQFIASQAYNGWKAARGILSEAMAGLADSGVCWWDFIGSIFAIEPHWVEVEALRQFAPRPWQEEDKAWRQRITRP